MRFKTTVAGEECWCVVVDYIPGSPMVITGSGFGDAEPPEEEDFLFYIETLHGVPNDVLINKLTNQDSIRLLAEFKHLRDASKGV